MHFNFDRFINKIFNRYSNRIISRNLNPFDSARIKLNLRLTVVFLVSGVLYGLTFISMQYYFIACITVLSSLLMLFIPITLFEIRNQLINYVLYISFGVTFAGFNIFGTGNGSSIAIMLWQIFIVHLSYAILSRKAAIFFGVFILFMFLLKRELIESGFSFPYWIAEDLVHNPRLIDIVVPAFFNLYLAYASNYLYERARTQIIQTAEDLRLTEAKRTESESRYQLIVEKSMSYITIHNLSGKIHFMNPAGLIALGCSNSDLHERRIQDFLGKHERTSYDAYTDTILRQGFAEGIIKIINKNGQSLFWSYRNVLISGKDETVKILGFAQDITELENNRRILAEREQEMEVLVSSLHDMVMLFNKKSELLKCWTGIPGLLDPETCLGKSVTEIFPHLFQKPKQMIEVFVRAVEIIEATQIANSDCWFRVKISPISGNDHLAASVHITDITHEHQMEILHQERMKIYTQKLEKYNSDLKKMTQHLAEAMRRAV